MDHKEQAQTTFQNQASALQQKLELSRARYPNSFRPPSSTPGLASRESGQSPNQIACDRCLGAGYMVHYVADGKEWQVRPTRENEFRAQYPNAVGRGVLVCGCQEKKRMAKLWGTSGVPARRTGCTFEGFDRFSETMRDGKELARELAGMMAARQTLLFEGEEKNSLCFSGMTGMGKSGLMSCIAQAWIAAGISVLWLDHLEYIDAIKKTYDEDTSTSAVMESAQKAPLLCLDDLGDMRFSGEVTDHTREKTYAVLRYRYEAMLPTVITTNLTDAQLYHQFGNRIADRIGETYHFVTLTGLNVRFGE